MLYMAGAMFIFVLIIFAQSLRVRLLFVDRYTSFSDISAYPSLAIGNMYNCLLPGNLGEGVRAWHFSKVNKKPITLSASVFITEKIFGAILLLPILVFVLVFFPFINHYIQYGTIALLIFIIGLSLVLLTFFYSKKIRNFIFRFIPFEKLRMALFKVLLYLLENLKRVWDNNMLKQYLAISYAMFFLNVIQYYFVLQAVTIDGQILNFSTALLLSISMMLVMVIPSAPGNIGVAHYGIYITLMFVAELNGLEVNSLMQQKFAIVGICLHFSYYIPEVLLGLYYLIKEHKRVFQFTSVKI